MSLQLNKKGFTLIELLAVIVVLAVIIMVAAGNIGSMSSTARKNILAVEGNTLVDSAKSAYQMAVLNNEITTGTACFSLTYLYNEGLFDKGPDDTPAYSGSVLVEPVNDGKQFNYKFWISNSSHTIENATYGATGKVAKDGASASETCGDKLGAKLFR